MFSRDRDARKVALVELVARLRAGGFALLDTQFVTEHLTPLRRGRDHRAPSTAAGSRRPCRPTPSSRREPEPFYLGVLGPEEGGGGVPGAGSGSGSAQPTTQTS